MRYDTPGMERSGGGNGAKRARKTWVANSARFLTAAMAMLSACGFAGFVAQSAQAASLSSNGGCANVVNTGGDCALGFERLSARDRTILAKKQGLAQEYQGMKAGHFSAVIFQRDLGTFIGQYGGTARVSYSVTPDCIPDPDTGQCSGSAASNFVNLTQQPQANYYYCGPATASEVLGARSVNKSQSFLAGSSYLGTDFSGETPWNPYVMHPTLNMLLSTNWYVPVDGSAINGTGFDTPTWESDLKFDIDNGWAIAGNIVESATSPHLVGHPAGSQIFHWIGIYGYTNYGSYTKYADSISGDTQFWSWAANVPPYSSFSSADMTTLLNQRGFVW